MKTEKAETSQLQTLLEKIGRGLDQFNKFEHPDALNSEMDWRHFLNEPLPGEGAGIDEVTRQLIEVVIPNGSAIPNPGFTGFITTGATTASLLASTASCIASPQKYMITAFNFLEELSLDWLAQMCGISSMKGIYSSGGSVANLIALGGARQQTFEKFGVDPAVDGMNRPVRIYASVESHHTIQRACGVLGVGRNAVKSIPIDHRGRMQISELQRAIDEDQKQGIVPMA